MESDIHAHARGTRIWPWDFLTCVMCFGERGPLQRPKVRMRKWCSDHTLSYRTRTVLAGSCLDNSARRSLLKQRGDILSIPFECRAHRAPAGCAAKRFDFRGVRHFSEVCFGSVRGAVCMRVVVHVRALVTARALHARHPGCWGGDGDGVGLRSTTCARCGRCAFARYLTAILRCAYRHMEQF